VRRITIAVLVLIVGVALLVGLHPMTPARTVDDYRHKAKDTAESTLSSVQTARLAARVGSRGDAFGPYVSVLLSESEVGAAGAQSAFESIQPPDHVSDLTRARLSKLLQRAGDVLSRLRITARRGELDRLERQAEPLRRLSHQLSAFIDDPGPS
jgi:hypothetical protein